VGRDVQARSFTVILPATVPIAILNGYINYHRVEDLLPVAYPPMK